MRTVVDNLGIRFADHTFTVLVATDLVTGEEIFWPTYRSTILPDFSEDRDGTTSTLTVIPQPDARNPYDVLAEFGGKAVPVAFSWQDIVFYESGLPKIEAAVREDTTTITKDGSVTHEAPTTVVLEGMAASLSALANYVGAYPRLEPQVTPAVLLNNRDFHHDYCRASAPRHLYTIEWSDGVQVLRISCETDAHITSLLVVMPPIAD